jgi:hypothetical protein
MLCFVSDCAFFRDFLDISFVFGLTKRIFGCILYDIGSIWSRCSPQKRQRNDGFAVASGLPGGRDGPKKIRKIFGKAFDKAEKCAIFYITRLIRS